MLGEVLIAQSNSTYRVLETSHPPSWYIPRCDIEMRYLIPRNKQSFCEWKGAANYWTVKTDEAVAENSAWSYESPSLAFTAIKGHLAFYPNLLQCFVDDEEVQPQPGGFYGGWITRDVVGPFKGVAGSWGW